MCRYFVMILLTDVWNNLLLHQKLIAICLVWQTTVDRWGTTEHKSDRDMNWMYFIFTARAFEKKSDTLQPTHVLRSILTCWIQVQVIANIFPWCNLPWWCSGQDHCVDSLVNFEKNPSFWEFSMGWIKFKDFKVKVVH